jgi:MFS family permease
MVYPLLPAFVVGTLGGSAATLGLLDGAADLTAAVTKWVSGELADRPRLRKPLVIVGYFSAILVRPFMSAASAAWQVVSFRMIDRIGKGLRTPARDAYIADATEPALRGRAFGFHRAADHFGSIPGALLAWWLLRHSVNVRQVLTWSIVPGVVAGLVLLVVLRNAPVRPREPGADAADATGRVFWIPVLALAGMVLLRLPETLLILRLQDLGVAVATIPLVWAGLHVVRSFVSYPGGWLVDRVGSRGTVALGGLVFALLGALLGLELRVAIAITVFLCLGLVAGLTESAERTLVSQLAPKRVGRGFGVYHAVTGLAALPAAAMFGLLYQKLGGGVAAQVSAAGMVIVTAVWLLVAPRRVAL